MQTVDHEKEANVILLPPSGRGKFWFSDAELSYEDTIALSGIDRGYIQLVEFGQGNEGAQMLLHEEGKLRGLEFNPVATELWERAFGRGTDFIVGPALILLGTARWT